MKFLSEYDLYTYDLLDEYYMGGLLNNDANEVYKSIARKIANITDTYKQLFAKSGRTPGEELMLEDCFENLVMLTRWNIRKEKDKDFAAEYDKFKEKTDKSPEDMVFEEALKKVVEEINLQNTHKTV